MDEPTDPHLDDPDSAADPAASPASLVFRGLEAAGIGGRELAAILAVSPSSVSKWRHGRAQVPAATLQFLTLLLAEYVEARLDALSRTDNGTGIHPRLAEELERLQGALREQETLNALLPGHAVREGTRRYRYWWTARALGAGAGTGP